MAQILQSGGLEPSVSDAPRNKSNNSEAEALAALSRAIEKSLLAVPEPRRVRDRDHVKSVAQRLCLICGRLPADAHDLRFAQRKALGRKVSDEFTVPLCRGRRREVHHCGDEAAWRKNVGIDPTIAARSLWLERDPPPGG